MPNLKIHNRTVKEIALPKGVKLEITIGNQKSILAVGKTRNYDVSRDAVIRIKPENTMMPETNWLSDGETSDLYIIPAEEAYGVAISYDNPDPDVEISYDDRGDGECRIL